jgi:hypothetical protein
MSIWTSKRAMQAILVVACFTLAACGGRLGSFGGSEPAPQQVSVTSDRVVVTGPEGFCVDPTATRDQGDTGFVLLGNCAAISNSRQAGQPAVPAILTAAISAPSEGGSLTDNLSQLDDFFRSPDGLRLLSRSGEAETVTVLDSAVEGDVFFLQARDTSESPIEGVQQSYWRAYMDLGARIATLSMLGLSDREISDADSRETLRSFANAVRAANDGSPALATGAPAPGFEAPPTPDPAPAPATQPRTGPGFWNVGLLRRILG